jgi:hypothetical protein
LALAQPPHAFAFWVDSIWLLGNNWSMLAAFRQAVRFAQARASFLFPFRRSAMGEPERWRSGFLTENIDVYVFSYKFINKIR